MIKLVSDTIPHEDIDKLREWLADYPRLTMGEETLKFEEAWANWLGMKYSVFVNSGSSANLLMIYALKHQHSIQRVAVPALSWATDLAPLIQFGIEPVLIDCNMRDLSMDLEHLEDVLKEGVDAVLFVSVLGLVPEMMPLVYMCERYDTLLIEDNCESMGSKIGATNLGTYALMTSHSLYYGHHLSTIEGGLISTNDFELYNLLKMLRSHGWSRDVDTKTREILKQLWNIDDFNDLYTFYVPGFNLRSTDLQAFIGLRQLERLNEIAKIRHDNFEVYHGIMQGSGMWTPEYTWLDLVSNFAYPVISNSEKDREWTLVKLKEGEVETRPLIAGSMGGQPFYKTRYGGKYLANANKVDKRGFYVPNHTGLTVTDIKKVCRLITTY